jgi:mutator protein MutT
MAEPRHVARAIIRRHDGRILLGYKTKSKAWELPGGKAEAEESPLDTAIREVREETGIDLDKISDWEALEYNFDDKLTYFVFYDIIGDLMAEAQPDEVHSDWRWWQVDYIDQLTLRPSTAKILSHWGGKATGGA